MILYSRKNKGITINRKLAASQAMDIRRKLISTASSPCVDFFFLIAGIMEITV